MVSPLHAEKQNRHHFICGAEGTHKPAPAVGGHVTVDLHALVWVSVDVYGVDAAQRLAVQQVLGTVLRGGKQAVSCVCGGDDMKWLEGVVAF